jgi:Flp pilus assembly protein TadG
MRQQRRFRSDTRGVAAMEFALVAPLFLLLLIGILQFGLGFYASAGLRNGVEAAARYAQIYPRPTDSQIRSTLTSSTYGLNPSLLTTPTLTHGTANGVDYVDISASYNYPLTLVFMPVTSVTLSHSRRAYQY